MRIRIAAAMVALVVTLLMTGSALIVSRSFALSMERERARALSEEAAIARAVLLELSAGDAPFDVAARAQGRYGSRTLRVTLVDGGAAPAGEALPQARGMDELLKTQARATLLCGESRTLYIAHALGGGLTLLLGSDVSPMYALRAELARSSALLCAAGALLSCALAAGLSGVLMRPVRALSRAARAMGDGAYHTPLPPAHRDEIGELTRAFSSMAQAVGEREAALRDEANRRQELIDALAHEMRTPLTAILGGARLLQRARLPREQQHAQLEAIAREAVRLSAMDERLLLLTRLGHEAPQMRPFSALEMAREALSAFENVALDGDDAQFVGERELTIVLLRNLVVNAQRAGGEAPVRVTLLPDGFAVADKGCGMTAEQIARAFEPFYKADKARSRNAGGAGLGLTLCRRIAQLHGGTLDIASAPGEGTRIVYRFVTTL